MTVGPPLEEVVLVITSLCSLLNFSESLKKISLPLFFTPDFDTKGISTMPYLQRPSGSHLQNTYHHQS